MKKRIFAFAIAFILLAGLIPHIPANASSNFTPITGMEMMEKFGIGMNIANTLETRPWGELVESYIPDWILDNHMDSEACWGDIKAEQWHFQAIAAKGFDHVRIPVTWEIHLDSDGRIYDEWMDRVQEVVDWALEAGLYVVINTHHENSTETSLYNYIDNNQMTEAEAWLTNIWSQIAERFKHYPETLAFELMNEPNRVIRGGWVSNPDGSIDTDFADRINRLNRHALGVVRDSGGNNDKRMVILTVPGANAAALPYYSHPFEDDYTMVGLFFYVYDDLNAVIAASESGIPLYIKETSPFNVTENAEPAQGALSWMRQYYGAFAEAGIPMAYWNSTATFDNYNVLIFNTRSGEWREQWVNTLFALYGRTAGVDFLPFDDLTILYSLVNDDAVQNLSVGTSGNAALTTFALQEDGGAVSVVAREGGGNAIQLVNRQNHWDGINILRAALNIDLNAHRYRITVRGRIINADENTFTEMTISAQDEPWEIIANSIVIGDGSFTLTTLTGGTRDGHSPQFDRGFRIQTSYSGMLSDFIIDDIIIETDAPPAQTPTPTHTPAPASSDVTISLTIGNINATVDGRAIELAAAPYIGDGGRTMVPVRFVADAMGATTDWDAATQTVTITHPSTGAINLVVGQALPDGMGTPEIVNGRTFVPVRFIADAMGGAIDWNAETQTVTIVLGG